MITIKKDKSGFLIESFPYNPQFVQKIKTIAGHRWYPEGKYWSFPDTDGTLDTILKQACEKAEIQNHDRRNTSSILPIQDKKQSNSFMNELYEMAVFEKSIGG